MGRRRLRIVGLVLALVAATVVGTSWYLRANQEDIFLEAAGSVGPNPFTDTALASAETVQSTTTTSVSGSTTTAAGPTTTALFGGSGSQKVCDPEALITFLESHPDKAKAWVAAINSDPTMKWSGGDSLTVAQIGEYIRELTPGFLAKDTRVTNHGFKDGKATPHQSVLQAGTAVLVDKDGVPRARCACGNPLLPPKQVDNPHYEGDCWVDETTTTTSSSTTTSSTTTSTSSTTSTTAFKTLSIGEVPMELIWARPSNRCGDEPYCAPPGCAVTSTTSAEQTTTTSSSTTTTSTTPPDTQVRQGGNVTTTTKKPGSTTTHVTTPAPTTTASIPSTTATTSRNQGTTTTGKP